MTRLIKYVAIFTLVLTMMACSSKKEENTSEKTIEQKPVEQKPVDQIAVLSGYVGRGGVHMSITIKGNDVEGTYYYEKMGSNSTLDVRGTLYEDGRLELFETNENGKQTGHFLGYYGREFGYIGNFANFRGTISHFKLSVDNVEDKAGDGEGRGFLSNLSEEPTVYPEVSAPEYYADDYHDNFDGYSDDSGSANLDELLDAYEECVDQLIKLSEKAVRGDANALDEYGECLNKYARFAEKFEHTDNSNLSTSQLNRLNRINNKYLKAAQKMM